MTTKFNDKDKARVIIHENDGIELRLITEDEVVFKHLSDEEAEMIFKYLRNRLHKHELVV